MWIPILILGWSPVVADEQLFGGDGAGDVPGLSGGVGNDELRSWMKSRLREPLALPDFPVYWFDGDNGVDGDCSKESPCKDAELIESILNQGSAIVRVKGDYNDTTAGGSMETWDGWDIDIPDCSEPLCAFLMPWSDTETATFDCSSNRTLTGSPAADTVPFDIAGGRLYIGAVNFLHCPPEPNVAVGAQNAFHLVGSNDTRVVFHRTKITEFAGVWAWAISEEQGIPLLIDVTIKGRDLADFNEACTGAQCANNDTIPLALCDTLDTPHAACTTDTGAGDSIAEGRYILFSGDHDWMILGGTFIIGNTQHDGTTNFGPICVLQGFASSSDTLNVVDDLTCIPPASLSNASGLVRDASFVMGFPPAGSATNTMYVSRSTLFPWPSGIGVGFSGFDIASGTDPGRMEWKLFQNTVSGALRAINAPGRGASQDSADWFGRCNGIDGLHQDGSGNAYLVYGSGTNLGSVSFDLDGSNAYDTDDGTESFLFAAAGYNTAAAVSRSNPDASAEDWTINADFFGSVAGGAEGPLESGGAGVDGDLFGSLSTQLVSSNRSGCTETINIPVLTKLQDIFEVILGQKMHKIRRGSHWKGIGAR